MIRFDIIICSSFVIICSWSYAEKSMKGVSVFLNYFSSKLWRQINVEIPCFAWSLPPLLDGNQVLIGPHTISIKISWKDLQIPYSDLVFETAFRVTIFRLHRRLKIALWNSFCHAFFVLSKFLRDYCVWYVCGDKCVCKDSCVGTRGSGESTKYCSLGDRISWRSRGLNYWST